MGEKLMVDPAALTTAGTAFTQAQGQLAGLGADTPLADAAGVGELQTADACRAAQSAIADATTALAEAAGSYGKNLGAAADRYEMQDETAAAALNSSVR